MNNIVILGILLSIIYYELTEISPGGIIVPGYIALFMNQPLRILSTICISIMTLLIINFISNYAIIYGRRKFALMIIISYIVRVFIQHTVSQFALLEILFTAPIGYIIPGIIAQDISRQGFIKTISSLFIVSGLVYLINIIIVNGVLV